jgi:tetratricopeptide (TPR) repeat protein
MAGRVNTKFVAALAAGMVLLVALLGAAWWYFIYANPVQLEARGDEMVKQGNWSQAAGYYGKSLLKQQNNVEILIKYADAVSHLTTAEPLEARRFLDELIRRWGYGMEQDPSHSVPVERLMALLTDVNRQLGDSGVWDAMLQRSVGLLEVQPASVPGHKFRGIAQAYRSLSIDLDAAAIAQAHQDLELALQSNADDVEVLRALSMLELRQARLLNPQQEAQKITALRNAAIQRIEKAVERQPDSVPLRLSFVAVLTEQGPAEANPLIKEQLEILEKQVGAQAGNIDDGVMVGDLLVRLDRQPLAAGNAKGPQLTSGMQRSLDLLSKLSQAHPDSVLVLTKLGEAQRRAGDNDQAKASFAKAMSLKVKTDPVQALRNSGLKNLAMVNLIDLAINRAVNLGDATQRQATLDEAEALLREMRLQTGESGSYNLMAGKLELARDNAGAALKLLSTATTQFNDLNPEALFLAARAAQRMNEWGEAAALLERLSARWPSLVEPRYELIRLYITMRNLDAAKRMIDELLQSDPNDTAALRLRAAELAQRGDLDKSIAIQQKLDPVANPELVSPLARMLVQVGRVDEARQLLEARVAVEPKDLAALQLLLGLTKDTQSAGALLDKAAQAGADARSVKVLRSQLDQTYDPVAMVEQYISEITDPLRRHLARYQMLTQLGKLEEAQTELNEAAKIDPDNRQAVDAQFNLALTNQAWSDAEKHAARAARLNLDLAEGLFYYGQMELARGRTSQAAASFRRGLILRPIFSEGHRLLGEALARQSDWAGALETYRESLNQRPNNIAALRGIAAVYDAQGDTASALASLKRALEFTPNDRRLLDQYLAYEAQRGDEKRATQMRLDMAAGNPKDFDNRRTLALLQARGGKTKDALVTIDALIAEEGVSRPNVLVKANVQRIAGDAAHANATVDDYLRGRGNEVDSVDYLLAARFALDASDEERAQDFYAKAIEKEDPQTRPVSRELGDLLFDRGSFEDAAKVYTRLAEQFPQDTRIQMRLSETLLRTGRTEAAETSLAAAEKKFGESAETLMLRAMISQSRNQTPQALEMLARAERLDPSRAAIHVQRSALRGEDARGQAERLEDLNKAIVLNPDLTGARVARAELKLVSGDRSGAIKDLLDVLERQPTLTSVRLKLANLYRQSAQWLPLMSLLEQSAKLMPGDATWPRMAGEAMQAQGRLDLAEGFYRRAAALAPSGTTVGPLATVLLDARKPQEMLNLVQSHPELFNTIPLLQALRGRALASVGRPDEAKQVLIRSLERCADINQFMSVASQTVLALSAEGEALISGNTVRPVWSAIFLAQLDAQRKNWAAVLQRLTAQENQLAPDTPERDSAMQLMALALHQSGQFELALTAYEELVKSQPDNVATLNNLAFLLTDNLNRPEEGLVYAQRAVERNSGSAQVLDTLGWAQFKAGQTDQAELTLRRSIDAQALAPNNFHLGEVRLSRGDQSEAMRLFNRARELAEQSKDAEFLDRAKRRLGELQSP